MEDFALYLIIIFTSIVIILNVVATYIVLHTYFEIKNRRKYQILVTWLIPLIGALLTIFINREDYFTQKHAKQIGNHPNISNSRAVHMGTAANHRGGR